MKTWLKGGLWGILLGIIILIISYVLPLLICPDFFRAGPAYPTDQPFCSFLINNPVRSHSPFPKILLIWIPCIIIPALIGSFIGLINKK